jgi:hypothetical protein
VRIRAIFLLELAPGTIQGGGTMKKWDFVLLGIWLVLVILAIAIRSRAFLIMAPVFGLALVIYLVFVTTGLLSKDNKKEEDQ